LTVVYDTTALGLGSLPEVVRLMRYPCQRVFACIHKVLAMYQKHSIV